MSSGVGAVRSLVVVATVVALGGCVAGGSLPGLVVGSGPARVEQRSVSAFTSVEVSHGIRLELVQGTPTAVSVKAQPNILPLISTKVSGETLEIDATHGFSTSDGVLVSVTAPSVQAVSLSGGAHGSASKIDVPRFEVNASGGAVLTAAGRSDVLDLSASGGVIVECGNLATTDATVELSGGVKAKVWATQSVKGSASGGVALTLRGDPGVVEVTTSGGSAVVRS